MKKLILSSLFIIMAGVALAQDYTKEEVRKERREQRQIEMEQALKNAIMTQNFNFTANTMQANIGGINQVTFPHNYVDVYPSTLDVDVPYYTMFSVVNTPNLFDFVTSSYSYTAYDNGSTWIVVIKVDDVINNQDPTILQSSSYTLHFSIWKNTGNATLTITPSMSDAMTYQGFVAAN